MPDFQTQRLNMVESQVRTNDVTDPRIQNAMRLVAREQFVPSSKRGVAYADGAIEIVQGRFLLEPRTLAKLLQLAEIRAEDSVLDVACATGYSTAVIALLARTVTGLEQDADMVRAASENLAQTGMTNASIVQGSLVEGVRSKAPFEVIFINGAVEVVPDSLIGQLAEGGRLVAVIKSGALSRATLYLKEHNRVGRRTAFDASAPLLAGFRETVGFVF